MAWARKQQAAGAGRLEGGSPAPNFKLKAGAPGQAAQASIIIPGPAVARARAIMMAGIMMRKRPQHGTLGPGHLGEVGQGSARSS